MINTAMEMLKKNIIRFMFFFQKNILLNKLMHKTDGRKRRKPKTNHNTTDLFKAILYTDGNRSTTVCYMF